MNGFRDYYALLGVDASASASEIKSAFKKMALQYHPDVYKGEDANERMGQILQAYRVLTDPEARREYDMQRTAGGQRSTESSQRASSASRYAQGVRTGYGSAGRGSSVKTEVSPGARRDRNRHYAFPDVLPRRGMHIDLVDIEYALTPMDAQRLAQEGQLRGDAPRSGQGQDLYFCHRCHHRWRQREQSCLPRYCPACHALDWPEYLLLRCIHCSAVFESEQIRYEIGNHAYGQSQAERQGELCPPYELFPLCPYCGSARWSPAEDERVSDLRLRSARRASLVRLIWFVVLVLAIFLLGTIVLGLWR